MAVVVAEEVAEADAGAPGFAKKSGAVLDAGALGFENRPAAEVDACAVGFENSPAAELDAGALGAVLGANPPNRASSELPVLPDASAGLSDLVSVPLPSGGAFAREKAVFVSVPPPSGGADAREGVDFAG